MRLACYRSSFIPRAILMIVFLLVFRLGEASHQTITVSLLDAAPTLDGAFEEWPKEWTSVDLVRAHPKVSVPLDRLLIKAGHFDGVIYFAARWQDSTQDMQHQPYVWDEEKNRYVRSDLMEDRFAVQFAMRGDYDVNWLAGKEFEADTWHWKSSRTNPLGLAHDKMTIISRSKITRSYKAKSLTGEDIYIRRPSDAGDSLYETKRYGLKESKNMPKYIVNYKASGSVADVKARSRWRKGYWNLELSRVFNTGNKDDIVFERGMQVAGGIAVFNRSADDNHVISHSLTFEIE